MKRILVPTDFSLNANKALDYALHIAAAAKASIVLVHILERTQNLDVEKLMLPYNAHSESIKQATEQLETLTTAASATGVQIDWDLYNGSPADSILQAIADIGPDLVLMGTLGSTGTKENFFGSITAKIIGQSLIPVLAIPLLSEWEHPNHILVAMNDFEAADIKLAIVIELAKALKTPIHLSVFTDEDDDDAADYIRKKRDIEFHSKKLQEDFSDLTILAKPIYGNKFEETINDYITEKNSSMLVMVTHKRSFLDRILRPSLTKKMSYHTNIPLLAIPV